MLPDFESYPPMVWTLVSSTPVTLQVRHSDLGHLKLQWLKVRPCVGASMKLSFFRMEMVDDIAIIILPHRLWLMLAIL